MADALRQWRKASVNSLAQPLTGGLLGGMLNPARPGQAPVLDEYEAAMLTAGNPWTPATPEQKEDAIALAHKLLQISRS